MGTSPLGLPLAVKRPTLQTDADLPPGSSPGWIRRHLRYVASELEGANITVRQSCGSISSTARMSGFHNLGLAALFALAFLAWGISSLRPLFRSISDSSIASSPAPAWKLKDLDGKLVKSSDFLGKVVILDFWATWCAPCKVEIPGFIALQKQYGDQGLVVIGVSLDRSGPAVVKRFMADLGNELSCGPRRCGAYASFWRNGNPNDGRSSIAPGRSSRGTWVSPREKPSRRKSSPCSSECSGHLQAAVSPPGDRRSDVGRTLGATVGTPLHTHPDR